MGLLLEKMAKEPDIRKVTQKIVRFYKISPTLEKAYLGMQSIK